MMFGKKKRVIQVNGRSLELEPKPRSLLGMLKRKKSRHMPVVHGSKQDLTSLEAPSHADAPSAQHAPEAPPYVPSQAPSAPSAPSAAPQEPSAPAAPAAPASPKPEPQQRTIHPVHPNVPGVKGRGALYMYIESTAAKHKNLEAGLRDQGIHQSVHEFVQRMLVASVMLAVVIALALSFLLADLGLPLAECLLLGPVIGIATYYVSFGEFINFPTRHARVASKNIERDILFAARDMIISLRSGMPLFNAITAISTGYADASKEFAKVVERVQLGLPLEDAIDQTASESKSTSFRRIMLQASTSIKAGADVVGALQSVIDQLSQERVIELRRYGQRLNAIAMFYMLFGIILPSMGIAVLTILTTFIAIFTVTNSVLAFALVGMIFLQVVFLQLIRGARPVYTM